MSARFRPAHADSRAANALLIGLALLVAVEAAGMVGMGAQRWLDLGVITMQPSEIMRLALPLMLAWYFHKHEAALRLRRGELGLAATVRHVTETAGRAGLRQWRVGLAFQDLAPAAEIRIQRYIARVELERRERVG